MKKTTLFLLLFITLQVSAMKNAAELRTMWKQQQPELVDATMNRVISNFPQVQDEQACAVVWTKEGQSWRATFPIMGINAFQIIDNAGSILHSERRVAQQYLPGNIKSAILELAPNWNSSGVVSSPVVDVFQIIDSPQGQLSVYLPGVNVQYKITFDNGITPDMIRNTVAYKVVVVNQWGVVQ